MKAETHLLTAGVADLPQSHCFPGVIDEIVDSHKRLHVTLWYNESV